MATAQVRRPTVQVVDWEEALGGPKADPTELAAETLKQRAVDEAQNAAPEAAASGPRSSRRHRRDKS